MSKRPLRLPKNPAGTGPLRGMRRSVGSRKLNVAGYVSDVRRPGKGPFRNRGTR
jgi:hypothetical protein